MFLFQVKAALYSFSLIHCTPNGLFKFGVGTFFADWACPPSPTTDQAQIPTLPNPKALNLEHVEAIVGALVQKHFPSQWKHPRRG